MLGAAATGVRCPAASVCRQAGRAELENDSSPPGPAPAAAALPQAPEGILPVGVMGTGRRRQRDLMAGNVHYRAPNPPRRRYGRTACWRPKAQSASAGRRRTCSVFQPNVNAKASTPGSTNSISNWRSTMGFDWRISWYSRCSVTMPLPCSSMSTPCAAPGGFPSMSTRKRTAVPRRCRAHYEMKIARVKAVDDAAIGSVQLYGVLPHCPVTSQRPVIDCEPRRRRVRARLADDRPPRRHEVLRALDTDVVFRRPEARPIRGRFDAAAVRGDEVFRRRQPFRPRRATAGSSFPCGRIRLRRDGGNERAPAHR